MASPAEPSPTWAVSDPTRRRAERCPGRDVAPAGSRRPLVAILRRGPLSSRETRARRRHRYLALLLAGVVVLVATGFYGGVPSTSASVDFAVPFGVVASDAVGVGVSTYGATPLTSDRQRVVERALDARTVRIPVAYRGGRITSGAQGAGDVDVAQLVTRYLSWGYRVRVVIAGRTDDVDVAPGDATAVIRALGYDNGVSYTTSNEPNNHGATVDTVIAQARMILAEGRLLHPGFRIWGPAWTDWNRDALRRFADVLGPFLAGVDFHRYAMGETAVDTPTAMAAAVEIGREVATTRRDLAADGHPVPVAVDELNLTWRYENGVPGGDDRLFTSVATAWLASACGHILVAGGQCLPYAVQNGPIGLTVEAGTPNPDGREVSSPMPGYWGVAAWTGALRFPHLGGRMYRTSSAASSLEVFAGDNEQGGRNVVLVNTATTHTARAVLQLRNLPAGRYRSYTTDPARPYAPPDESPSVAYGGAVRLTLAPMSVTTLVLTPGSP